MEEIKKRIKNQIEFYLSDENLETDKFFNELISQSNEGYIDISTILNCNIIKESNLTKEEIFEILKDNENVELNKEKTKIRRKNNKKIPEINEKKLLEKKRKREKEKKREKQEKKHPIILTITSNKDTEINPEQIKNVYIALNPKLEIIQIEFNINIGYIAIKKKEETSKLNFVKIFEINDIIFNVKLCEGKELINFWDKNSHLLSEENLNNKKSQKVKIRKKKRKLKEAINLGNKKYDDFNEIKNEIDKITENKELNEEQIKFIKDLIKYHPDKNIVEKVIKSEIIEVKKNEENKNIFFAFNKNKEKLVEFQVYKCTEKIILDDNKKESDNIDDLF